MKSILVKSVMFAFVFSYATSLCAEGEVVLYAVYQNEEYRSGQTITVDQDSIVNLKVFKVESGIEITEDHFTEYLIMDKKRTSLVSKGVIKILPLTEQDIRIRPQEGLLTSVLVSYGINLVEDRALDEYATLPLFLRIK